MNENLTELFLRLAEPFDPSEVKWKPQAVSGNRALAIAFVDARVVQDRLDEILTPAGWEDAYEVITENQSVVCRLRVKMGDDWMTKMDVGSTSEQPDGGDRMKAAFSDALKRASVKFGIGRYLYRLPSQWCDYDPQKRLFLRQPQLPIWAMPKDHSQRDAPQGRRDGVAAMTDDEKVARESRCQAWAEDIKEASDAGDLGRLNDCLAVFVNRKPALEKDQIAKRIWGFFVKACEANGWRYDQYSSKQFVAKEKVGAT